MQDAPTRPAPDTGPSSHGAAGRVKRAVDVGRHHVDRGKERFDQTLAGEIWARLSAIEFIDRALLLAGVMTLWLIPALLVLDDIRGKSIVTTISDKMGLNADATTRLSGLFRAGHTSSITIGAAVVVLFGLYGATSAIEELYELAFGLEGRGPRDAWRRLVWPFALIGASAGLGAVKGSLGHGAGSQVAIAVISFVALALFFWWSMHFLLAARRRWGELVAPAVVTALCWLGFGVFSSFYFSRNVVANDNQYGPIGIVLVMITWLLAVGVVIILGPVVGTAWTAWRRERREGVADGLRGDGAAV